MKNPSAQRSPLVKSVTRSVCSALLLSIVSATAVSAQERPEEFDFARAIKPEIASLENGLDIVVISDHRVPVATHMLWYRVGAADEVAGKSGLAHFFEHLLFKGTKAAPDDSYNQIISRNGGQVNAFTSWDFTAYFARVAKDRLPLVMELEADRMQNLTLTEDVFLPERDVILEERAMRIDNNPSSLFREQMQAALYQNHRYGVPVIGWAHEIGALTQKDAFEFYERYYAPNNAILIVSGDVTMEEILPLAEKYYGHLKPSVLPQRIRATEPPHRSARRMTVEDERVRQPYWLRYYLAPTANTGEPGEYVALEVLSAILGEGPRSRLHKRLVLEEGKAVGAGTSYFVDAVDLMDFSISVSPRPGVDLSELETLVDEEIALMIAEGVTKEEVDGAVKTLVNGAIFALDDPTTLNQLYGYALTTGGTIDRVLKWSEDIRGVTPEDVQEAARRYLTANRSVTGQLLPAPRQSTTEGE